MDVELGKIVGVWGVKGWIKLHSYTRNRGDIANYQYWWLQENKKSELNESVLTKVKVLNCREQGKGMVAQLAGIDTPEQGLLLNGHKIFVAKDDLPALPKGEYYWNQLIGLSVINLESQALGEIESILETGANDVLVLKRSSVQPDKATAEKATESDVLIPYVDQYVKEIDLENATMLVDWDPSFLD